MLPQFVVMIDKERDDRKGSIHGTYIQFPGWTESWSRKSLPLLRLCWPQNKQKIFPHFLTEFVRVVSGISTAWPATGVRSPNQASNSQRSIRRTGSASASAFLQQTAVMRGYSALQGTEASVPYRVEFPSNSYSQVTFDSGTSIFTGAVVITPLWRCVWHLRGALEQPSPPGRGAEKTALVRSAPSHSLLRD